jgi:hypothetical protein
MLGEGPGVPSAERRRREGELAAELERLERHEEALVMALVEAGFDVGRRPEAAPSAILQVAAKQRAAA